MIKKAVNMRGIPSVNKRTLLVAALVATRAFSSTSIPGSSGTSASSTTASPAPGSPFHLAIPVRSIPEARDFYGGILGLAEGRRSGDKWQDYSLYGHQIVCHYVGESYLCNDYYNPVDGDEGDCLIHCPYPMYILFILM
jgi:hypothetical protein